MFIKYPLNVSAIDLSSDMTLSFTMSLLMLAFLRFLLMRVLIQAHRFYYFPIENMSEFFKLYLDFAPCMSIFTLSLTTLYNQTHLELTAVPCHSLLACYTIVNKLTVLKLSRGGIPAKRITLVRRLN